MTNYQQPPVQQYQQPAAQAQPVAQGQLTKEQEQEFFKRSFTLQGRIFHPSLLTARLKKNAKPGELPKYSVMFLWPKNSNGQSMQEMMNFITQAFQTVHPGLNHAALVHPIKDYDTYVRQDGKANADYQKDSYWLNGSSGEKFPIVVVGPDRQPVLNEAEIYSGRNAVLNVSFYNMNGGKDGTSKKGIGINLNAVMLLDGGERVSGGGQPVDPNTIFGNFQADMNLVNQGGVAPSPMELQQQAQHQHNNAQAAPVQPNQYQQPAPVAQPAYTPPQQPVQGQPFAQPAQAQPVQQPQQGNSPFPVNPNQYV